MPPVTSCDWTGLGVTDCDWHYVPMDEHTRQELGRKVAAARLSRGLGKEPAARAVGVSSITLKRVEDGLAVREDNLAKILSYFDVSWPEGVIAPLEVATSDVDRIRRMVEDADVSDALKRDLLDLLEKRGERDDQGDGRGSASITGA